VCYKFQTQVSTLICDSKQLKKLPAISSKLQSVKHVIYIEDEPVEAELKNWVKHHIQMQDYLQALILQLLCIQVEVRVFPRYTCAQRYSDFFCHMLLSIFIHENK
jgi:PhoPQ-activated pathogenicity-related protein